MNTFHLVFSGYRSLSHNFKNLVLWRHHSSSLLKLKEDVAHIGISKNASARNTHFNDDNLIQNDAYPFHFFFRTFKITLKCDPGKFPGYKDGVTEVYSPLISEYVRTMVLQLYLPYFYFQWKENDSFSFHILSCFRGLCFGQMFFNTTTLGFAHGYSSTAYD